MKILYIASERSRAQVATRALRTISPNVTVLWGSSFERAAFSILENPDLAALIVEVQSDSHGCSYLRQMGTLGVQAPVVMVLPEGAGSPIQSLKAGAAYYVEKGPTFSQELPAVVSRTIGGAQGPDVMPRDERRSETAPDSAVGPAVDRRAHRDFTHPRETEHRVTDIETSLHQQEQRRASEQSAAAGRQAKLETLVHQEREIRAGLEQKLAHAEAALRDAEQRHLSATTAATATLAERRRHYEIGMARATTTQEMLEERLRQSRQSEASAVADVERLTRRNAELSSMLTEATATGKTLEGRLAHLEAALDLANQRASRHPSGAAEQAVERQAEFQAQLEQEVEKRRTVEVDLARAKKAHDDAEKQRSSVVTAATALWAERQARFEAELASAAEARHTLDREARELKAALDQARQTLQAHVIEVERLTQREAGFTSQLAQAATIRTTLERRLTDAVDALKDATEGASRNRLTAATKAAERELELDGLVRHERAMRADVEQRLAQVEAALRDAEQQHAAALTAAAADRAERQGQFESELSQTATTRDEFKRRFSNAEAAVAAARNDHAAVVSEVERLTQREAQLASQLAEGVAARSALERQLTDAADALKDAQERAGRDRLAAEARAAEREVEFNRLIGHERATRADIEQRLAHVQVTLREAEQQHASHMSTAATEVELRTQREADLSSQLAEAAAARSTLERQLTDAADALKDAQENARHDRLAAETRAAEREVEFDRLIGHERATRADVEQRLAQVGAALREAEQQHTLAVTAAATERAEREAQFEIELSQTATTRDEFKRRFSDAEAAVAAARNDHAAVVYEVDRLTQREAQLASQLAEGVAARSALERQLTDAADALKDAQENARQDRLAAETRAAEREIEFDRLIGHERATRADVEQRLAQVDAALRKAERQHTSAMSAAAIDVERRTQREAELSSQLAEAASMRSTLERQLTDAADALKDAQENARHDRLAAETRAAEREAQFDAELAQAAEVRTTLGREARALEAALDQSRQTLQTQATEVERLTQREAQLSSQLAQVEVALRDAEQQHTLAMTAAATERAERQAQFESELSQTSATRDEFKRRFSDAETALAAARQDHAAAATHVERLTQRETELSSQLAQVEVALRDAEQKHTLAMTAAATERAERQAQFESELSQTSATRDEFKRRFSDAETALAAARHDYAAVASEVERLTQREAQLTSQLAQVEVALRDAEQKHTLAMTAAATERVERQAQFDSELSQTAATRDEFKQRFSDAETALAAARHDHAAVASEVERLTQRETDLTSQLTQAASMRSTLERQLTDAADALKDANDGARRDRLAAETSTAEREAEFDRLIGHERATRADVEQRLAQEIARREALDRTVAEMHSAAADAEQQSREQVATLTERARDERTRLESESAKEREAHDARQAELLNEIRNLEAARGALDESLASIREQSRRREIEHHNERDGLDRARSNAETEVRRLATELSEAGLNLEKGRREFQQTLDRVTGEHADSLAKLVVEGAERDARIEDLEKQLDENRRELRGQFQHAPLALWRCTRDGALTDANATLANLVGYRQPDELQGADFVKATFESTDDLSWLIERCLSTKTRQSVDTAWKRRNGERLVVRLSATELAPDMIEIGVEDVTSVRVLEDRLVHAQRMEAVGRLASEIAITCGRLLRDVHEDGQQWLMAVSADTAIRKRGERLLGEVTRAASYLERLAAHGDEQANALKPVELNRVLRDLRPVLKHVAGDDVDLELSKTSSALNVDMKADRVERLLVNLASYGRERMPDGGRLKIELGTVVVDQKFIADHPNVRRGHHALITVTAMRRDMPASGTPHTGAIEPTANEVVLQKPGVDLGALQELLQECGGHLWLTVDPPGNMVVKIRLPLRVWDDRPHSTTSDTPTSRKRVMPRWFRH